MPEFSDAYAPHVPARYRRGAPAVGAGLAILLGGLLGVIAGGFGLAVLLGEASGPLGAGSLLLGLGGFGYAGWAGAAWYRTRQLGEAVLTAAALEAIAEGDPALGAVAARAQRAAGLVRESRPYRDKWLPIAPAELDRAEWTILAEVAALAAQPEIPAEPGLDDLRASRAQAREARLTALDGQAAALEQLALGTRRLELTAGDAELPAAGAAPASTLDDALSAISDLESYLRSR
ncbi:hypothetical protein [Longispora albida]|uniref:hypothetical protein n=1 Tax=Longispora albida TaxID=203523 RepID=UPI00037EC6A2|nr:hypothetical protein [Longispora albida]